MKNLFVLFSVLFLASCQSKFTASNDILNEKITVKYAGTSMNGILPNTKKVSHEWYFDLSELGEFKNYEEENGILLEDKLSVGIYTQPNHRKEKLIVLEEIKHQNNGEAKFRKLHSVKVKLEKYQFLHTEFCHKKDDNNNLVLAIYEGDDQISYAKNFIKAWHIDLQNFKLLPTSSKDIVCQFKW